MTEPGKSSAPVWAQAAIATASLSMLTYQILLTRVSALRLFFHFSFLVISNCLLGIGAAGTLITIRQEAWRPDARFWIHCFSVLYLVSLVLAYAFVLTFEIEPDLRLGEAADFLRFTAFNLVAALPFFFAGAVVGMILTFHAEHVNRVYSADLLGAGVGALACPFLIAAFGAGGCFVFVALTALLTAAVAQPARHRAVGLVVAGVLGIVGLWLMPRLDQMAPVPGKAQLLFTESHSANVSEVAEHSQWSTNSRIDVTPVNPDKRFLLTRGQNAYGLPLPDAKFILQDGSAGTVISNFSEEPEGLRALELSMYSAAVRLVDEPRVLVIGVGGGNDVWAAKHAGARSVKGIELNRPILEVHTRLLPHFSRALLEDPGVELVHGEGRSALMGDPDRYDVIQMTGIDTWTALTSGAYMLAENYLYTREAISDMYAHLEEGGVLQIIRMSATMESLRLLSVIDAALRERNGGDLAGSVAILETRDWLAGVLVKKGRFSEAEVARLEAFAEEAGISVVYLPGRPFDARRSPVARFVASEDRAGFIRSFPRNIAPTTDDRPYFFNFTRWTDPFGWTEHIEEPSAVSQGNPLFILAQLAASTVLAVLLIVTPLVLSRHRRAERHHAGGFFVYFVGLGMGFIAIEIALIQKLTLFLGHPLYSITVTLFSILIFTGLGSLLSAGWFRGAAPRVWLVPAGIAAYLVVFVLAAPAVTAACIGWPLPARIAITVAALAPGSFLLGVPLAYGIRVANARNRTLVPWAWAVNASFTVVGSILSVVVSMNFGFNAVLLGAAVVYGVAFAALPSERPSEGSAEPATA